VTEEGDTLKEKLDALQCHFTWQLGVDSASSLHILHKVAVDIQHTQHQNRVALLGLQAYLQQLRNDSTEALRSLSAAEEHNGQAGSAAGSVTIYGNYAWVYYLQGSYQEAERYLEQIQQLCPTPWDAGLIADIQAQKGWSLLLIRIRNGERARECFETALMLQPENTAFRTGLAMALYSSWNYFHHPDFESEAITHMQRIIHKQPKNYRAKIYLARLIEQKDKDKAVDLAEACTENSSDPEVLKSSVWFWLPRSLERAMEIIQRVLQEDPGYHLLYQTLATCYKQQWIKADEADKSKIVDAAIKDLQQIVETHPDLDLTPVKLQLAEFLGAKGLLEKEEEIYKELQRQIETLSLRCRHSEEFALQGLSTILCRCLSLGAGDSSMRSRES
uniref:Uncharacterized protein n=1 Tax=Malurus cyaneus samueli TaxID=2593467 RepID=A0A8C5T009_9PASS